MDVEVTRLYASLRSFLHYIRCTRAIHTYFRLVDLIPMINGLFKNFDDGRNQPGNLLQYALRTSKLSC